MRSLRQITLRSTAYAGSTVVLAALLIPAVVGAQGAPVQTGNISAFVTQVGAIFNLLLPVLITLAVLFFFWGLALFVFSSGDESARDRGKSIMIWGVIALFIIVSIWGIIAFIGQIFGIGQGGEAPVPGIRAESTGGITAGGGAGGNQGGGGGTIGGPAPGGNSSGVPVPPPAPAPGGGGPGGI